MKIARWSKKDRRRGISEEGEEAGGSKAEADAGAGWTGIRSYIYWGGRKIPGKIRRFS